jgi:hypothetical protein
MTYERKFWLCKLALTLAAFVAAGHALLGATQEQPLWALLATLAGVQVAVLEVLAGVLKGQAILKS